MTNSTRGTCRWRELYVRGSLLSVAHYPKPDAKVRTISEIRNREIPILSYNR